jgi:hypothetical protein
MPSKFKVTLVWRHVIEDYSDPIEVEAENEEEARKIAEKMCDDPEATDGLEWNDGEVVEGEYIVPEDGVKPA